MYRRHFQFNGIILIGFFLVFVMNRDIQYCVQYTDCKIPNLPLFSFIIITLGSNRIRIPSITTSTYFFKNAIAGQCVHIVSFGKSMNYQEAPAHSLLFHNYNVSAFTP